MPYGEHRVRCHHCGIYFNCGDCIKTVCHDCEQSGHQGFGVGCPVCEHADKQELRDTIRDLRKRLDEAIAEIDRMKRTWKPKHRRAL